MSEDEKIAEQIIKSIFGEAAVLVKYIEYDYSPYIQKSGVDFVVILQTGRIVTIDDKTRRCQTKDLCIEVQKIKQVFYPKRTSADILLYRVPGFRPLFVHTSTIDILFLRNPLWQKRVYKNRHDDSYCAYIPIAAFKETMDSLFGYLPRIETSNENNLASNWMLTDAMLGEVIQ
jgi:hypothetical protein